jgi:hypothetical protein
MRISALCLLLPAALVAQPGITVNGIGGGSAVPASRQTSPNPNAPAPPPTKPEDLCSITGQVMNGVTGAPLRRASLVLMRADPTPGEMGPPLMYSASSDAAGQFTLKDVEPGRYRLTASRNGYVNLSYGARGPSRPGTTISLVRQQRLTDLTLKMTPHAIVTGRILEDDGEPVANARVMLQSYRYLQGRKQLVPSGGGGSTNDLGEFRLFGVAAGKYFLSVTPVTGGPAMAFGASSASDEDYVATYYPGTIDPAAAAQLDVAAGSQIRGIDMVLSKARTVRVKGKVTHDLPTGRSNTQVTIMPRNFAGFVGSIRNSRVDAAGNFEIRGVTPGAYVLTAMVNDGTTTRQGRLAIDVGSAALEGVQIAIGAGISVTGRVRSESESAPVDLSALRFMLQLRDQSGIMFSGPSQGKADQAGAFEIKNASPDRYNVTVFGLPSGAYVKSIRTDQVDVLASGLDLSSGAPAAVEVVISPRAASVSGSVQNTKTNNPAPAASVVFIPQEKERRDQQYYFKFANSDQHGAFSFADLPPGEYKAYAWEDMEPGAHMDPDFVKQYESQGEAVSLQEGDRKSITLKLIPADQ